MYAPGWELLAVMKLSGTWEVPVIYSCGKGPFGPVYRWHTTRWQTKYTPPNTKTDRIMPITGNIALVWEGASSDEDLLISVNKTKQFVSTIVHNIVFSKNFISF